MLHLRHFVGRSTLRALLLASAVGLAAGSLALTARAEPASVSQTAFTSDRLSVQVIATTPDGGVRAADRVAIVTEP